MDMTEIAPERISEFLRIVFVRLWQEHAGLPAGEALAAIPQATQLSEFEGEPFPTTRTPRFEHAVRLAIPPFVQAGWLLKSKGRWYLSEEGKQACKSFTTADAFYQQAGRILAEWRQNRSLQALVTEQAEEMAWEQVRSYLLAIKPFEFQILVEDLLLAMGYHLAWVAPPEKSRGLVNFVIFSDPLGLSIPRIKVHVLHGGQPVLVEGLKAFQALLGSGDAGIFISSGGFTRSVIEETQAIKSARITLVDLENFFDLWVEYYDRLTEAGRQRLPLKPIHFLGPLE
jgi:restriction system protein